MIEEDDEAIATFLIREELLRDSTYTIVYLFIISYKRQLYLQGVQ